MKKICLTLQQKKDIGSILKQYLDKKESRKANKLKYKKSRLKAQKRVYVDEGYQKFSSSRTDAYNVSSLYGIDICPYCNMNCTHTVIEDNGTKVCRPDFDHFEPKYKVPWKALNVTNLIPCCIECNERVKKTKPFNRKTHVHPYYDDFDSLVTIKTDLMDVTKIAQGDFFKLIFDTKDNRAQKFIDDMKLVERYNCHKSIVRNLVKRIQNNPAVDLKMRSDLAGSSLSVDDVLYPELKTDILNNSFAKLRKDIIKFFK